VAERTADLDYSLEDVRDLRTDEELRAVVDGTRRKILRLLRERAASTTELAVALEQPKGTIAHHVKVLEDAGLIRVVRTRKVRAMTERYYGRVARLYRIVADTSEYDSASIAAFLLRGAADEIAPDAGSGDDPSTVFTTYARMPENRAREFGLRLEKLADEFRDLDEPDERVFGFALAMYATDLGGLPKKTGPKR
jgi:DNA-binding transcriptional ArsR family regulator